MAKIIIGMIVSSLLPLAGFRNLLFMAQKGRAGPIESQLSVLAPVLLGTLLYLFFASQRKKIIDSDLEYLKRRRLL